MDPLELAVRLTLITLLGLSAFNIGFMFGRRDGVRKFERAILEHLEHDDDF